jgi:D-glycerate 3-kinase
MVGNKSQILEHKITALIEAERLPAGFGQTIERFYRPLADHLAGVRNEHSKAGPLLVGINGGQGSGKSTLALFLKLLLEEGHSLKTAVLSLDDLYLTRAERTALAKEHHPLLATRGVPGTHDVALGMRLLGRLAGTGAEAVSIPRFDKAQDDRAPLADWSVVCTPVEIILLEGWCVGACPQAEPDLHAPVNTLERDEDKDGVWRRYVNDQLAGPYAAFFARLDHLIMLKVPNFECVEAFRTLQESKLREKSDGDGLMDAAAIKHFIMHYERLTRHMLAEMPARAEVVLELDASHTIDRVVYR